MKEAKKMVDHDVVVVGAGFAGIYAVHELRRAGLSVRCFEAGDDVGGVWYWNRYPGARCDVESLDYSYSFSAELQAAWKWQERYAPQPEILDYLRFAADRLGVREALSLGVRVTSADYDEADRVWRVTTDCAGSVTARRLVWATGPLTVPVTPDVDGLDEFEGRLLHSARWPHESVNFHGRRVAVLGTGSSGIQMTPVIAASAEHLSVLQRTANFSVPARNFLFDDQSRAAATQTYGERRRISWNSAGGTASSGTPHKTFEVDDAERRRIFDEMWQAGGARFAKSFVDLAIDEPANTEAVAFVHDKIRELVDDPEVAERLLPRDHALGARRLCVDTGYYETFNRENVTLVDLREEPLVRVTARGVVVGEGREIALDDLVLATGFDGVTGALGAVDVRGRDGVRLRDVWRGGPVNYLGFAVHGFPDMFLLNGPGSPSVLANMVLTSEQQVNWLTTLLAAAGDQTIEAEEPAQDAWTRRLDELSEPLLAKRTRSWYTGANVPGKPQVFSIFAGGFHTYRQMCDEVAERGYEGLDLR